MQQAAFFSPKLKQLFTFERIFFLILVVAIVVRFWNLDFKLFHHDEAIHSWFSYELLTKGTWVYDPSYHGPFLYYVTAGMFSVFGDSDMVARILPALFGTLLIPLVYCIYRLGYINKTQTLVAAVFLALSPDMVYFSRFLRHDIFMLFFTLLLLVALLYYFERGQTRFAIIAAIAAAGGLACKEEMPIILLIFATFFIYAIWKGKIVLPTHWKHDLALGLLTLVAILAILYSGFGVHPETLQSGWLEAIRHWMDMHNQQRLGGPWFFYIPLFLLYELPIFILAVIGIIQFMYTGVHPSSKLKQLKNWIYYHDKRLTTAQLAETTLRQLKDKQQVYSKSDEFFRFCIYWMLLTMAFYAYVGEKVPWLLIHQLLPMCFVAVYKLNWQKTAVALIGCIFLVVMTWHVAFVPADINEPIVQVQNSEDLRTVMQLIDASDHVVVASKDYWPLPWYYRGEHWNKISFYGNLTDEDTLTQNDPGVIILHDTESLPSIQGYDKTTLRLSYWFSVYDNQDRMIDYYLHRDGKMGSINIDVFTHSKTA
ncbi:flippase activity-associated protein Agl23 [uncultured Methanoregula sp.]|uniref:flippase activity-associated protein Agl23 n=1 Tax=uncultured Methanoregula sp. TaxID=1005933 RepID=UPI002AAB2AF9|nr:flippase activity-associated protein Agl23 [uncultured Methanoregula sp.]